MKKIVITALILIGALCVSVNVAQGKKTMGNKASLEKTVNTFFEAVKASNIDIQLWTWQGGRWRLAASQVTNMG